MKKRIIAIMMGLTMMVGGMTAYAAEATQSPNWFQDNGTWKVRDGLGNIVSNSWFCDLDGSWYLMDEAGCMREGIINDNGHYYSLETAHAGHYGMMRTVNGVYGNVYLTFQQEHNGFYGEILSGAQELINTGVKVTTVNGLPANSVYAKDFVGGGSGGLEQNQSGQQQAPAQQTVDSSNPFADWDTHGDNVTMADYSKLSPEEQAQVDDSINNYIKNRN